MTREELQNEIGQLTAQLQKRGNELLASDPLGCKLIGAKEMAEAFLSQLEEAKKEEKAPK